MSVSHLRKAYGPHPAVRDISFELTAGVTGLLGPNGAGKSTLARCLVGLSGWEGGDVRIDGIDPARRPADARRKVGYMPERVSFPPEMRVEDYLRFVSEYKGIRRSSRSGAVEAALCRTGLEHVRTRIVANLSKGYRQRVGLAQALLADPPVVVLDEPSAGVDPLHAVEIRDVLRAYAAGRAVLVSTHVLPETRALCDRVLVMSQGRLVYDGPPAGMTTTERGEFRARIRLRGNASNGTPPQMDEPGTRLVSCGGGNGHYVMVVETEGEVPLGTLVSRLSGAGWLVVCVEPVADGLEEAFRDAVLNTRPAEGPRS